MKKKIRLKEEWIQSLLLNCGTRKQLAEKADLNPVTVANVLNGGTAGPKVRDALLKVAKEISKEVISMTDVFYVE